MFKVKEIVEATSGKLLQGDSNAIINAVSTDTRSIQPNDLFIAIKGPRYDGHDFIRKAIIKKAKCVIAARRMQLRYPKDLVVIFVPDTVKALADIAYYHRNKFKVTTIAVTGSNGKTTTKDMTAFILAKKFNVLSSVGTHNNHIGVPQTLLKLRDNHEILIVELGTNHKGEIFNLSKIVQPDIAVFTNIGQSHLEFFKNTDYVFEEKISLLKNLNPEGYAIYNKDDDYLKNITGMVKKKTKLASFSIRKSSLYRATNIVLGFKRIKISLNKIDIILKTPASHNIYNALAAIACSRIFKVDWKTIKNALEEFKFPSMRFNINRIRDFYLIDDSYNSNPSSLRSAIEVLSRYNSGRKFLVCGDMLELGKFSKKFHFDIGKDIIDSRIDFLITVGKLSRWIAKGARKNHFEKNRILCFDSSDKVASKLKNIIAPGDIILVKGSRSMAMEKIVEAIKNYFK